MNKTKKERIEELRLQAEALRHRISRAKLILQESSRKLAETEKELEDLGESN